jgi:hypothetical protein
MTGDHDDESVAPDRAAATCVWQINEALVVALDAKFGEPHDAYVNGSQVWLRDDGPNAETIEWRLHPVASYVQPKSLSTYQVFPTTALAVAEGNVPPVPVALLWDGLEAFVAYDDNVEPLLLASVVSAVLGIAPDAVGLVHHEPIAAAWQASSRTISIVDALFAQLRGQPDEPPEQH